MFTLCFSRRAVRPGISVYNRRNASSRAKLVTLPLVIRVGATSLIIKGRDDRYTLYHPLININQLVLGSWVSLIARVLIRLLEISFLRNSGRSLKGVLDRRREHPGRRANRRGSCPFFRFRGCL